MIKIDVDFYDAIHEKLLRHSNPDLVEKFDELVRDGIKVDTDEFVTHTIFTDQKNYETWRNYEDLKQHLPSRRGTLLSHFDFNGTVRAKYPAQDLGLHRIEDIGVGTAILAINRLFDVHEADWEKIPVGKAKSLDFRRASTGSKFIEIEAKGSVVSEDISLKTSSISQHKAGIVEKKLTQRGDAHKNTSLMFGAIAAIPTIEGQNLKCWLLDPPGNEMEMSPQKYRILARLMFYLRHIRLVSQSRMLIGLANRIEEIQRLRGYEELNNVELVDHNSKPFRSSLNFRTTQPIFGDIELLDGDVAGKAFPISNQQFMFYGFDTSIFSLLAKQNFHRLSSYKSNLGKNPILHTFQVKRRDLDSHKIPIKEAWRKDDFYAWIPMAGDLIVTRSGRATAILEDAS